LLILTLAINPVFEEMIETGYFVRSLERYGMWGAVLGSALFRAFLHAHLGVNAIVVVFPIGLIFGFVYWRRRQLWPLVVAHALFDLCALLPQSHAA
jgi:membrane protease YdiL (CAAX protease family)